MWDCGINSYVFLTLHQGLISSSNVSVFLCGIWFLTISKYYVNEANLIFSWYPALRIFGIQNDKLIFLNVLKFTWVTAWVTTNIVGSIPTCMQRFIICQSSCSEQYGDVSADTQTYTHTHSHTNKLPTAGVQLVGYTTVNIVQNYRINAMQKYSYKEVYRSI